MARAYKETLSADGRLPPWARKLDSGQWQFDAEYIRSDARQAADCIGIEEAASILGATRRTVQNWVDCGEIATIGGPVREKGERRRILRGQLLQDLPRLRKRLETPAVLGFKMKHGVTPQKNLTLPERIAAFAARMGRGRPAGEQKAEQIPPGAPDEAAKARAAAAVEEQLREAQLARRREAAQEAAARKIAERLIGGVFGEELGRIDAMIMFNQFAARQGISDDLRVRIRKEYFGR